MYSFEVILERVTYNWPSEKHSTLKCNPATLIIWPCDLLMTIAKDIYTGNCRPLNWNAKSDEIREIRKINTSCMVPHPVSTVHTIMKDFSDFTRFLNKTTGQPTLNTILIRMSPDGFYELRNFVGK